MPRSRCAILREDEVHRPEERQRLDQDPQVAEPGIEVFELELGDGQDPGQRGDAAELTVRRGPVRRTPFPGWRAGTAKAARPDPRGRLVAGVLVHVGVGDLAWGADRDDAAPVQQQPTVTVTQHRLHLMRDEDDRPALSLEPLEVRQAPFLECGVTHRQHLVEQQHLGVNLGGDREREPHDHAGREVLQLQVDERLELRERDDLVEPGAGLRRGEPEQHGVGDGVVASGQLGIESDPELDEWGQAAGDCDRPPIETVDPCHALHQRALAGAVASDDGERLAAAHLEADVIKCLEHLVVAVRCRLQDSVLRGRVLLAREPERLAHAGDPHRRIRGELPRAARARRETRSQRSSGGHRRAAHAERTEPRR